MKIRVPFAWFWYGDVDYGNPEVESGTIASSNPTPPAAALQRMPPLANDGGAINEKELVPPEPSPVRKIPETPEERIAALEERLAKAEQAASSAQAVTHPQGYGR